MHSAHWIVGCSLLFVTACAPPPAPSSVAPPAASSAASSVPATNVKDALGTGATIDVGEGAAPLDLVLFTNHSCGYCRDFHNQILPRLRDDFIAKGKLRLRIALLPMQKYPSSDLEAAALFCAQEQGKSMEMHGALFAATDRSQDAFVSLARGLTMDADVFATCLASPAAQSFAQIQHITANRLDVTLAPTLFLGNERQTGLPSYADLRGWIESTLP